MQQQALVPATCLRRVEIFVKKVAAESTGSWLKSRSHTLPTLEAFANAVAMRLECLRKPALEKELEAVAGGAGTSVTLLSLLASMSWVFAGAEFLMAVVLNAVPEFDLLYSKRRSAAEVAAHILTSLYDQLNDICLLEDGEEEAYRTILLLFVGTLRPLTKSLDAWLQEGTLSDPSGELFFYADYGVPIEDSAFWQRGYQLRRKTKSDAEKHSNPGHTFSNEHSTGTSENILLSQKSSSRSTLEPGSPSQVLSSPKVPRTELTWGSSAHEIEDLICPIFLQCLAKTVVSAGKSLQLLQHVCRGKGEGERLPASYSSTASPSLPHTPFSLVSQENSSAGGEASTGLPSSHPLHENIFPNFTEDLFPDPGELSTQQSQVPLYEELCTSLRRLVARDCTRPIISSLEPDDETIDLVGTKPASKSGNYMETFYEIQEARRRHKELRYIWSREQLIEDDQNRDEASLHETNLTPHPDGQSIRFQLSSYSTLCTTASGNDQERHPNLVCDQGSEVAKLQYQSGSIRLQSPTGFQNDFQPTSFNVSKPQSSTAGLFSALNADSVVEVSEEDSWRMKLSANTNSQLPPLNDSELWESIFAIDEFDENQDVEASASSPDSVLDDQSGFRKGRGNKNASQKPRDRLVVATDYSRGEGCGKLVSTLFGEDLKVMERLMHSSTELPSFKEKKEISEFIAPHQHNQMAAQMLDWLQQVDFKTTPSPAVLVQECLILSIERRVHSIGQQLLERLMGEWRLVEELALLRAIYLVGSGDLLQQFASVLFNKLDRGESWDDYYELNTMLQESVRSSAHGMTSPALESLVVSVESGQLTLGNSPSPIRGYNTMPLQVTGRSPTASIDTLDSLRFSYKVAWPLELIIDSNAIKKYNQVMTFLMKVKRAKHALDKACRWTWKNGGGDAAHHKQRLLLQQKLMHFVNTLHQYVMDQVLYSSWLELSEGMASAGSLDEVIAYHDAYLVSIQRQCLVAPDKLWALIAGRVKAILGLALEYYSIQRTLCDGVAAPNTTARCQSDLERVERQFYECMVFLLRVLSFNLNVGHFPHFSDLVTRINYNHYYMTPDRQILTPIPDTQAHLSRRPTRRV
uniref:Gamma-tubulin complex component n=1 Tax=Physcomitrium patens TaxID=3218 RepID=A0A7I4ANN1_PHYPA